MTSADWLSHIDQGDSTVVFALERSKSGRGLYTGQLQGQHARAQLSRLMKRASHLGAKERDRSHHQSPVDRLQRHGKRQLAEMNEIEQRLCFD